MTNHKRTETAAKLKKFYSTMSEAIRLSEIENGLQTYEWPNGISYPNSYETGLLEQYILRFINYSKVEKLSDNVSYYENVEFEYKDLSQNVPVVYLNDGSMFYANEFLEDMLYDTNGEKGPNQVGRDIFRFAILTGGDHSKNGDDEIENLNKYPHFNTYPSGFNLTGIYSSATWDRERIKENCAKFGAGSCTYLIHMDGWEIKNDYPLKL